MLGRLDLYRSSGDPWETEVLDVAKLLADGTTAYLVIRADRERGRLAQVQLHHFATHDSLTGLGNRFLLLERLDDLIQQAAQTGAVVAAIFVVLDDFAQLNTVHGHRAETGYVAITAHAGAALASASITADDLVDEADNALYESLESPPGTVRVHDQRDRSARSARSTRRPTADLDTALSDSALSVQYQPIVTAARPHQVTAVEALMRWRDRNGVVIPAESFIDTAARKGLMPAFGAWMIDQASAQLAAWHGQHGDRAPARVYVNLSARELNDPMLPGVLAAAVDRHGLDPAHLGLEIVEENFVHNGLLHRLRELRARGHHLAIDDFGTGHSSLARLIDCEVDTVKIDKALVRGLARDAKWVEFMRAIVALSRSLNVQVTAEGVETVQQRDHLLDAGVDGLQGYLFGPPAPADRTAELFTTGPTVLIREVLGGRAAIVTSGAVGSLLRSWFDLLSADISRTIDQLEEALDHNRPTRNLQKYLGVEISWTS